MVIASTVLVLIGYFWLTGQPLGQRGYHVYLILPDGHGLARGDRVNVAGVEVGVVRSVTLEAVDRVSVRLFVEQDVQMPSDSRAILQSVGVFGDQLLVLRPGVASSFLADGDTLELGPPASALLDLVGDLGKDAEIVLAKIDRLLADSAIEGFHDILTGLRSTIGQIEQIARSNSADLKTLSSSLARTALTLEETLEGVEIDKTIADLEETAAMMAEAAGALRGSAESLSSVAAKIDRGEGTLGLLVNDSSLYVELRNTTRSIGALTTDIQMNPGRYLKMAIF